LGHICEARSNLPINLGTFEEGDSSTRKLLAECACGVGGEEEKWQERMWEEEEGKGYRAYHARSLFSQLHFPKTSMTPHF
jgi:hypothetical protein